MNIFISFLVLLLVLNEDISCYSKDFDGLGDTRFSPDAVIHQLSELIRNLIRSGDDGNGVPILDPTEFQLKQVNVTGGMISVNISITNGKITGLGDFKLQGIKFSKSEISIELKINIPSLKFYSEYYELAGNVLDIVPLNGQGKIHIEVHNITLCGKAYLRQSDDSKAILLDKIGDPHFTIESFVSQTQFDNNIDGIFNAMIEDLLADCVNRFNTYFANMYTDTTVQYLNPILEKYDTWRLIAVLLSG